MQGANVVGIDLRVPCFSHGQLYVAYSWLQVDRAWRYYCQKVLYRPLLMLYGKMPFSNPGKCNVNTISLWMSQHYMGQFLLVYHNYYNILWAHNDQQVPNKNHCIPRRSATGNMANAAAMKQSPSIDYCTPCLFNLPHSETLRLAASLPIKGGQA